MPALRVRRPTPTLLSLWRHAETAPLWVELARNALPAGMHLSASNLPYLRRLTPSHTFSRLLTPARRHGPLGTQAAGVRRAPRARSAAATRLR